MKNINKIKGQVALLAVLILGGSILGASAIAGYLVTLKIRQNTDIINSTKAIFAADAGIEWELYKQFKGPMDKPVFTNGASIQTANDGVTIKSLGKAGNSFRAFESVLSAATSTLP